MLVVQRSALPCGFASGFVESGNIAESAMELPSEIPGAYSRRWEKREARTGISSQCMGHGKGRMVAAGFFIG